MIILDTNIVSEMMKTKPDQSVSTWFENLPAQPIRTTVITTAEIYAGLAALPEGRRRRDLETSFGTIIQTILGPALPFDQQASEIYGALHGALRAQGQSAGLMDTMIASIVSAKGATLATRNVKHFEPCGIPIINPFVYG